MLKQVQNGIALLDARCPNWRARINLDTLDVGDPDHCVLAQVYDAEAAGGQCAFEYGLATLELKGRINHAEHGFDCYPLDVGMKAPIDELTAAWKAALRV